MDEQTVSNEYKVDECDAVYDEEGIFYCMYFMLTDDEKKTVKQNPFSAR